MAETEGGITVGLEADQTVEFEQIGLDLALGQALVLEVVEKGDEVQDPGRLFLEIRDIHLWPVGPHL